MYSKILLLSLGSTFLLIGGVAFAESETELSSSDLLEAIVSTLPEQEGFTAASEAATLQAEQALILPNPTFESAIGGKESEGEGNSEAGPSFELGLSQELDVWGRRRAEAEVLLERGKLPEAERQKLVNERYNAAARNLINRALLEVRLKELSNGLTRTQELLRILSEQSSANPQRRAELGLLRSELAIVKSQRASYEAEFSTLESEILSVIPWEALPRTRSLPNLPSKLPDAELILSEGSALPALLSLEQEKAVARAELRVTELSRYPTFEAGPYYSEEHAAETEREFGLRFSVPLPLWDNKRAAIEASRRELKRRELLASSFRARLLSQLKARRAAYLNQFALLSSLEAARKRDVTSVGDEYRTLLSQGTIPLPMLIQAEKQELEIGETVFEARRKAYELLFSLEELLPPGSVVKF